MQLHIFFIRWCCGIYIHHTWLIYGKHMKKRRGLILSPINKISDSKMRERRTTLFTDFHFNFIQPTEYLHIHIYTSINILVPAADWWLRTWASPSRDCPICVSCQCLRHSSIPSPHEPLWMFSFLLHLPCGDPFAVFIVSLFCGRWRFAANSLSFHISSV